jgi:hypothetical protein
MLCPRCKLHSSKQTNNIDAYTFRCDFCNYKKRVRLARQGTLIHYKKVNDIKLAPFICMELNKEVEIMGN